MCGLIAIIALRQQKLKADTWHRLDLGLAQIKHRGPDSEGKWISPSGRIALGHVRLKINDLSPSGNQPLHDEEQTVHAVVNGEIYEYDRLRLEMIDKLGYKFGGTSDCELVLALYKCYGLSFLSHLRGEFSLCLYDSKRDLFIAVRDRYGIKPLFWTIHDGELLIAAEMKAFLPLGWNPEWAVEAIVRGSFQIGSGTIFRDVRTVCPGHYLMYDGSGEIKEQQYWDMDYPSKLELDLRTEDDMVQGIRSRLLDAIRVRLRADVKIGVALSGGIDSSVVAGMVNHLIREGEQLGSDAITERLSCFGVAFDEDSGFDESSTANRTADFLGVKYYKKHMNEQALADSFEDATWMIEQPNPDLNFVGLYALSELVREQGFRVILNGQGSDEIFGGYPLFLPDYLSEVDISLPRPTMSEESRIVAFDKVARETAQSQGSHSPLETSSCPPRLLTPAQMSNAYPPLPFKPEVLPQRHSSVHSPYVLAIPDDVWTKMAKWHPFHCGQYIFCKGHLDNLILSNLGDRGEMAHSIEGRTPFLDHLLTEYANSLPPSMKIHPIPRAPENLADSDEGLEFVEKYVLREAARPFVTDEIYKKRKHPYSAPLQYGINGPLHQLMTRLITKDNVASLGFLDWASKDDDDAESLGDLVHKAFADKDEAAFKLVICISQWVVLGKKFGVKKSRISPAKF